MKAPTIETTDEFTGDIRIVVVELDVVVAAVAAAAGLISCPPGVAAHAVQPLRLLGGGSQHPDRASTELLVRVRPRVAVQPTAPPSCSAGRTLSQPSSPERPRPQRRRREQPAGGGRRWSGRRQTSGGAKPSLPRTADKRTESE